MIVQSQKNQTAVLAAFMRSTFVRLTEDGEWMRIDHTDEEGMTAGIYNENKTLSGIEEVYLVELDPRKLSFMELVTKTIPEEDLDQEGT